jgi:hypothetical protein
MSDLQDLDFSGGATATVPPPVLEVLAMASSGARCSTGNFARALRSGFVADRMDWAIGLAEEAACDPNIDEDTRFLIQALLIRDMAQQNDRECALGYAEMFSEICRPDSKRADACGRVYFIRPEVRPGRMKIGYSTSPNSRLRALQIGSPDRLILVASFRGTPADERKMHRLLAPHRVSGEWFHMGDDAARQVCSSVKAGATIESAVAKLGRKGA